MLKKLFKESLIYGLSGYISKFISIFLLPLYTSVLTPADYGIIDLLGTLTVVSSFLIVSGTDSAFGYYYFRREFAAEKKEMVASTLYIRLIFSAIIFTILFFAAPYVTNLMFHKDYTLFIRITALTIGFSSVYFFLTELLRFEFRPWLYTFFSTASVLIQVLLAIYFVLILKQGVYGAILAAGIAYALLFLATVFYVFKRYGFKFSAKWFKNILKYGFPLIGTSIAVWILQSTDRYFLTNYTNLSEVGIYAVGMKLAGLLGMISGTLQFAWGPFAADIQYEDNARQIYAKVFEIFFILNLIAVFIISMFSIDILKVFTQPAFYSAKAVVPFLCLSTVMWSGYSLAASGISLAKKLIHTIWITVSAAALNIILNFIFTPMWGVVGAAFSLMISYIFNFVIILMISQKYYPIPYKYSRILYVFVPAAVIISVSYYFGFRLPLRIIITVLFAGYFGYFIYSKYRHTQEFQKIVEKINKFKSKKEIADVKTDDHIVP